MSLRKKAFVGKEEFPRSSQSSKPFSLDKDYAAISLVRAIQTVQMEPLSSSQKMIKPLLLGTLLGCLAVFPPPMNAVFPLCGFRWLTGMPCPLCGMTRALSLLLKGQWEQALRLHSLSPIVLVLLLAALLNETLGWILPMQFPLNVSSQVNRRLCLVLVVSFSCYGFFRLLRAA